MALGAAGCARVPRADALARLRARGTLRWGGDVQGGEPYVFQDLRPGSGLTGFEVEIADGLARRLGVRAEFVQNDWQTLIPSLERGDFDVALNGIEVTPARRARVAFTRAYYAFSETLVVPRAGGDGVHGLGDLRGRRVGTLEGSLAYDLLRAAPGLDVVLYEGVEEPYLDLERGRLAAVVLDNIIAARYGLPRGARGGLTLAHLPLFLRGAALTVVVSVLAMALAVLGGLGLCLARRYGGRMWRAAAGTYVEVFRGTPVLLQLYVIYYGLAPLLTLDAFTAAVVGLGLNYAAYESELYRAGLDAVPVGQTEAALALGMSRRLALRRIVLPQALRVALPGMANDFIALLKDSSLVSVITVVELTKQMTITAVDVRGWLGPGLLCAALYLAMSYPLARLARRLERRLAPAPA
ncbi:MAG: ABC transporter permease subunit [Deltaproteobacteria bacterium]|nr:MAG: ABC transporter permease subunit [Deltaproteobacteria bacterium]